MESADVSLNQRKNSYCIPTRGILEHFLLKGKKVITVKSIWNKEKIKMTVHDSDSDYDSDFFSDDDL